jgi:hypothetical protein
MVRLWLVAAQDGHVDVAVRVLAAPGVDVNKVGRCRLTASKPELKACLISALEN